MKSFLRILPILALALISLNLSAQDEKILDALAKGPDLDVEQRQVSWLKNDHTAHVIAIVGEEKDVAKAFEGYMGKRYKLKFSRNKGWEEAAGVLLADIIAETVIFAYSTETSSGTVYLRVIMDLGGASINAREYPQAKEALDRMLADFARQFYGDIYAKAIDQEEKELKSVQKELAKLTKEREKAQKTKEKAEKSMKELEADIREAEKTINEGAQAISDKEEAVKKRKSRVDELRKGADKVRR